MEDFIDTSIDFDQIQFQINLGERTEWRDRKDIRIQYCGYQKLVENAITGEMEAVVHLCGEPDCRFCGRVIRRDIKTALMGHLADGPLRYVVLSGTEEEQKKQRARLMRKYGKGGATFSVNDVLSEDGLSIEIEGVIKTEDEIGEELTEITDELVERWANKSYRHAKSGYLHRLEPPKPVVKKEEEDDEDSITVLCQSWLLSTKDKELLEKIKREVQEETRDLIPQKLEDIQPMLCKRREVWKGKLEEKEIVILDVETIKTTVKMDDLKWKGMPKPQRE